MKDSEIRLTLKLKHEEFINSLFHQETKDLIRTKTFFAGGAIRDMIRGEIPKDYDLFFIDEESVNKFKSLVKREFSLKETMIGNFNDRNSSVQVITLVSGSPTDVVNSFDFTINQGYYIPQMDVLSKGSTINILETCPNVYTPLQALLRIEKFRKMGYDVPMETIVNLGVAISKLNPLETSDQIRDALKGMSFSEVLEGY